MSVEHLSPVADRKDLEKSMEGRLELSTSF
jgi:hypothetical protein